MATAPNCVCHARISSPKTALESRGVLGVEINLPRIARRDSRAVFGRFGRKPCFACAALQKMYNIGVLYKNVNRVHPAIGSPAR